MEFEEEDYLAHYGVIRRSGRYPWGSGGDVKVLRNKAFLDFVADLKKDGMTESQIAQGFGMRISELRAAYSIESNAAKAARIAQHQRLRDKAWSVSAIAARTGHPESTVRADLKPGAEVKADILTTVSNKLKSEVEEKGFIEVGKGVEASLGVSRTRLDTALEVLKQQGYEVYRIKDAQTTGKFETTSLVLAPPGTTFKDVVTNKDKIQLVQGSSVDGGRSFPKLYPPIEIDPKRVQVIYGPDGGSKADGVIYIRPGVEDVSIGGSRYAQVRVAVGKDHYLKGMAVYKDDLPPGIDIQFNTNKESTGNKLDAMKKNSDEKGYTPDGPHPLMKSITTQLISDPGGPNERVTSAMNIVNQEGAWENWSRTLSSQMLSKQSPRLIKAQLDLSYEARVNQLEAINKLTNPTVKRALLRELADSTDAASVHLKAAALPKTASHVILPLKTISPGKIYAPNYQDGSTVVLIRHPHGGKFEIPELVVDNKNREGRKLFGSSPRDAVGIHYSVAAKLSGADFDGDTVLVIPNDKGLVKVQRSLDKLKDFDPRSAYPGYPGMKRMRQTQGEMGNISNLITDMSLQGATTDELARAVKHSMVVIDAEKHNLDYRRSELDNGIRQLKQKYQTGGATTLISRAGSPARIPERKERTRPLGGPVDLTTGARAYEPTGRTYKSGKPVIQKVQRLALTDDAYTLMSSPTGTPVERLYADYSNKMKALANKTRLAAETTPSLRYSPSANKAYKTEVESLNSKLFIALKNAPLERQANRIANAVVKARLEANPNMDEETKKKISYQALTQARIRTGAIKTKVVIEPKEWEAIQAGAISDSKLKEILRNSDMEVVKQLASPKTSVLMSPSKTSRAKQMLESGYTRQQVASHFGVSLTTLDSATE